MVDDLSEVWTKIWEMTLTPFHNIGGGRGGGGLGGLAPPPPPPPLRMISHRNYLSWSGAENRDKDRDTLIEQSL